MIAKFLVVLAAASQIGAFKYCQQSVSYPSTEVKNCYKYEYPAPTTRDNYQRIVTTSTHKCSDSQNLGYITPSSASSGSRHLVARGKYPVTLQSCGPAPDKKISVLTSHLRAPLQEKPTVRLETKIPAPKTVSHTCTCFKTILKPRVHQHIITVPSIQRYIETVHRPVVENIHYEGYPVRCLESCNCEGNEKSQVETFQVQSVASSPETVKKSEKVQVIQLPKFQFTQGQQSSSVEIPRVQYVQQQSEKIEIPRIEFVEKQKPEAVEGARVQFVEARRPETLEIPIQQFLEGRKSGVVEVPASQFLENKSGNVEFLQSQKLQSVEIPEIRVAETPEIRTVEIPREGGAVTLGSSPYTYRFNN